MPKVKDEEFLKRLDQDMKLLNIDCEEECELDDAGVEIDDGGGIDGFVRLKNGLKREELINEDGFSFEVIPEGNVLPDEKMYLDDKDVLDPTTMQDRTKSHWNPDTNDADAELFYQEEAFNKKAESMDDITEAQDRGVMKKILQKGQGNVVPKNALVKVHYNAFHEGSNTPYDSSRLRGQEQRFQLGSGDVISGMDLGVSTMRKNELSSFIIQPNYAYGPMGCAPRIPPKKPVMIEIELMNFFECEGTEHFFAMTKRERDEVPFEQILKYIRGDKDAAKDLFIKKSFRDAIGRYLRCIRILEECSLADSAQEAAQETLLRILYLNTAQCFLNLSRPARTIVYARKALYLNDEDIKASFKLGKALRLLGNFDEARHYLQRARRIKPMSKEIGAELEELEKSIKRYNAMEREQCRRMFSKGGILDGVPSSRETAPTTTEQQISKEFKSAVDRRLNEFILDNDLVEIRAGNGAKLADFEIAYIAEEAHRLGLYCRTRNSEFFLTKIQKTQPIYNEVN